MTESGSARNSVSGRGRDVLHRVFAVVVTFNPDLATFGSLLVETRGQVEQIIVVDNGSRAECVTELVRVCTGLATLHALEANVGIAAAQNKGVAYAQAAGATDVLLLDHDSVPAPGMVASLCEASDQLRDSGSLVAAVGPLVVDRATRNIAPVPQIIDGAVSFIAPAMASPTRCEYLIASGMLIKSDAFKAVGPMNEAFFVDQVDVEWCLRAGAAGFSTYCVPGARLDHAIGDSMVKFWMLGWREMAVHTPIRDYFYFRNSLRLVFSPHVASPWRWFWKRRLLRLFILELVFVPPRWLRLRAMVTGVWAAVCEHFRLHSVG